MLSIGVLGSASQGASYYERDGYYAKDDPEHKAASAWAGAGAAALGLDGEVDADVFRTVLEGKVPDGSGTQLGRRGKEGSIEHRPGRDLTFSAPKSVSLAALVGGDERIVDAHDRAVAATLAWVEKNAGETRMQDPATGRMVRAGSQKIVAATFRHDTSRNLHPQLHTHAVLANLVQGEDGKWRSMANEGLYERQKLIGMLYRSELARGLSRLGYGVEKTHADGRFEIAGVARQVVEAFSTRRAEIEAAMAERGLGDSADSPRLAERAALMTRAAKRDIDREELRGVWERQAAVLGFDARALVAEAASMAADPTREAGETVRDSGKAQATTEAGEREAPGAAGLETAVADPVPADRGPAADAVAWAMVHLSEREAVFARADLLAAALAHAPGAVTIGEVEREVAALENAGTLHGVRLPGAEDSFATDEDRGRGARDGGADAGRRRPGPLPDAGLGRPGTSEQGSAHGRAEGGGEAHPVCEGPGGRRSGLRRNRQDHHARPGAGARGEEGWRMAGLAPSASAVKTLSDEAGIESGTLQGFLARNAGVAEGRLTSKGAREMRAACRKTILVVDEGSLASTVQARDLLRIASELRIPRVVLVGDAKQLDAVDAGKPFAQLQAAGMQTAVMDEIMRQRDPALKEAVEASLAGEIGKAFEKLGPNVAEVKPDNIGGAVAARWLALSPEARENTGVMAPSHELRHAINGHIRERLAREGRIHGPAMEAERLVSKGYTDAEKALAASYAAGDVMAFHRPYKRIGVEKGDERRVVGVDHANRAVLLEGKGGGTVAWKPGEIGGRKGGTEVYRAEWIELRAGNSIRWTRNDTGLGLVNSRTAEVAEVRNGRVTFQLEDGRKLELGGNDPQLRHLDHAWASTVHAFQGRTVDNVIAAMEARHPHLTTQKSFYVEISRARDRAELVTDDAAELKAQLQAVTGERIAALEGIGAMERAALEKATEAERGIEGSSVRSAGQVREGPTSPPKDWEPPAPERGRGAGMDLGLKAHAPGTPRRGTGGSGTAGSRVRICSRC